METNFISKKELFNAVNNYATNNNIDKNQAFDIMLNNVIENGYIIEWYNDTSDWYDEAEIQKTASESVKQKSPWILSQIWSWIKSAAINTGEFLEEWAKAWRKEFWLESNIATTDQSKLATAGKVLWNFFLDVWEWVGWTIKAIAQPIETWKAIKEWVWSWVELWLNKLFGTDVYTSEQRKEISTALNKVIADRYDNPKMLLDDMVENPFDTLTLLWGWLKTIWKKGSVVEKMWDKLLNEQDKILNTIWKVPQQVLQKTTDIWEWIAKIWDELSWVTPKKLPKTFDLIERDPKFLQDILKWWDNIKKWYIEDMASNLQKNIVWTADEITKDFVNKIEWTKQTLDTWFDASLLAKWELDYSKLFWTQDEVKWFLDNLIKNDKDFNNLSNSQYNTLKTTIDDFINKPNVDMAKLSEFKSEIGRVSTDLWWAWARVAKSLQDELTNILKSEIPWYAKFADDFVTNKKVLQEFTSKFYDSKWNLKTSLATEIKNLSNNPLKIKQYSELLNIPAENLIKTLDDIDKSKDLNRIFQKLQDNRNLTNTQEKLLKEFDPDFYREFKSVEIFNELEWVTEKLWTQLAAAWAIWSAIGWISAIGKWVSKLPLFWLLRQVFDKEVRLNSKVWQAIKKLEEWNITPSLQTTIIKELKSKWDKLKDFIKERTNTWIKAGWFLPDVQEEEE